MTRDEQIKSLLTSLPYKFDKMLDVLDQLRELVKKDEPFAVATVIKTWRSSPRPVGSCLLVNQSGDMYGSVSGGCVENAAVIKALEVLKSGEPQIVNYGVADEEAWEIGLSCGGAIEVHIAPFFGTKNPALWKLLDKTIQNNRPTALITALKDGKVAMVNEGNTEVKAMPTEVLNEAEQLLSKGLNSKLERNGGSFFVNSFPVKPKMILIGSAHITVELIELAQMYDFETVVIDPRDTFAHKTGYKVNPDTILVNWPQEVLPGMKLDQNCYIVILSHDPKIDDEALKIVLKQPVKYIGALGSRKTHLKRVARLESYGFNEGEIAGVKSPIGIDIKSQLPREIALSIMGEIISEKNS
jgi:xanthine dehydrogenase accessory factor